MSPYEKIFRAQELSTPIIAVDTHDHIEFINKLILHYSNKVIKIQDREISPRILIWDINEGIYDTVEKNYIDQRNIVGAIKFLHNAPAGTLLVLPLIQEFLKSSQVQAAIITLRNIFLAHSSLILVDYGLSLPAQLQPHCIVLQDKLPDQKYIAEIAKKYLKTYSKQIENLEEEANTTARILSGLNEFLCEQIIVNNITKSGLPKEALWKEKCSFINQIAGIEIQFSKEGLDSVGGLTNIKQFFTLLKNKKDMLDAIIWLDEIEKMLAGSEGVVADNTGISQGILQTLLVYMQEKEVTGMIFLGPPGTGKSMLAKAAGKELEVPVIFMDIGAMKSGIVGSTEANVRRALKTVDAIAPKQMWIATTNNLTTIPNPLRRRFTYGIWFFDLPSKEEKEKIWEYYVEKYGISKNQPKPEDAQWTGAEIKNCCRLASDLNISLLEAAKFIVPVAVSMGEELTELRKSASNRYLSASYSGLFVFGAKKFLGVREVKQNGQDSIN